MANETINFTLKRTGSDEIVMAGKEVNQTLTLTNKSTYDISSIYIKDTLSEGITFNSRSVYIDGVSYGDANPVNGFNHPSNIKAGNSSTVTYKITVDGNPPSAMSAYSSVSYTADGVRYENENSDVYKMELANGDMEINKTSNKSGVISGETLTYQIEIKNIGNVTQNSVFLKDDIPAGTELVSGSIKVDGETRTNVNLQTGFTVGNVYAKDKKVVTFNVKVL